MSDNVEIDVSQVDEKALAEKQTLKHLSGGKGQAQGSGSCP